jgi:hypothetical protein
MLFGLISGIRDARSPLIVGYVVLSSLWLLLFNLIPESTAELGGEYPELARMYSIAGPVGAIAAFSFAAYLIGDLIVRESARVLQIRSQPPVEASDAASRQKLRDNFSFTHDAEMDELELRLEDLVERTMAAGANGAELDHLREELAEKISTTQGRNLRGFRVKKEDEDAPPVRLSLVEQVKVEAKSGRIDERILAANPELYSELSRLRGEAEFRAGLLPALALLYVAVAIRVPWSWWLLALLGAGLFLFEYLTLMEIFQLRTRARGIALRAVVDEMVSTPTLDAIKREREAHRGHPTSPASPSGERNPSGS